MVSRGKIQLLFACLMLAGAFVSVPACAREDRSLQAIHRFMLQVESGPVEKKLLRQLESLARENDPRAVGLLAWHDAERGDTKGALERLTPLVLKPDASAALLKNLSRIKRDGDLPNILESVPPAREWSTQHPELCICMARVLASAGHLPAAAAGFNLVGEKHNGVPRVLAAEGIGDMSYQLKSWEKCVSSYEFALKVLGWLRTQSEYLNDPDKAVEIIQKRISAKLAKALEAWDAERYGPGFVAYRRARREELGANFLPAAALYSRIIRDFPDTVYAEAAACYRGKCLLALSEKESAARAERFLANFADRLASEERELRKYEKQMTIRVRELYLSQVQEDKASLARFKNVPLGKKAAATAIGELEKFIADNEHGLYRGETMQTLGDYHLETLLDVEKAFGYYARCYKWLGDSTRLGKELSEWTVPDQAAYVTRPPPAEKELAGWSQWIEKTQVKPEQIINRIHCHWYLDSLRARNGKMLSLCFFIKGDNEQAVKAAKAVIMFEPLEKMMYEKGQFNSYSRLIRGYELGWMRCMPQELALFSDKLRTAVVLGDFYYEVEDEERCENIRRKLAQGDFGRLNRDQDASAKYRLAEILHRRSKREETNTLLQELADRKYRAAYSSPDILIAIGNLHYSKNKPDALGEAARCYGEAAKRAEDPLREKAMYYHASALLELGESKRAADIYKQILKQYPKSRYRDLTMKDMARIEK